MTAHEHDPDVVRWGLHHLFCSLPSGGSPGSFTRYDKDFSRVEYVREGYCEGNYNIVENDEVIARALQEEFSRLAVAEANGFSLSLIENQQSSTLAQDWHDPYIVAQDSHGPSIFAQDMHSQSTLSQDRDCPSQRFGAGSFREEGCNGENYSPCSSPGDKSVECENNSCLPEISDESTLDGEVGKRLNQMVSIPHVPKINGELPTADEEISDHQRLMDRLQLYDLVELTVSGDGNCQVRALPENLRKFVPLSAVLSVEKLAIEQPEECSHKMSSVTRSKSGFTASELVAKFKGKGKAEGSNLPQAPKLEVGDKVMVKRRRTQEVVDVEITVPSEDELEKKIVAATGLMASEVKLWKEKATSSFKAKIEAEENLKVAMDMLKKKNEEIEAKDNEWVVRMAESGMRHSKEMESLRNELMAEAAKPVFEARIEMIKEYQAGKHTEWDLEEEYAALRKIAGEEVDEVNSKVQEAGKAEQVGEMQEEKVDEGTGEE